MAVRILSPGFRGTGDLEIASEIVWSVVAASISSSSLSSSAVKYHNMHTHTHTHTSRKINYIYERK